MESGQCRIFDDMYAEFSPATIEWTKEGIRRACALLKMPEGEAESLMTRWGLLDAVLLALPGKEFRQVAVYAAVHVYLRAWPQWYQSTVEHAHTFGIRPWRLAEWVRRMGKAYIMYSDAPKLDALYKALPHDEETRGDWPSRMCRVWTLYELMRAKECNGVSISLFAAAMNLVYPSFTQEVALCIFGLMGRQFTGAVETVAEWLETDPTHKEIATPPRLDPLPVPSIDHSLPEAPLQSSAEGIAD